jgi:hypothetical protein
MDDTESRTVKLRFPKVSVTKRKGDSDLWISFIENILSSDYTGYTVTILHDYYQQRIEISIIFASNEDAVLFKLSSSNIPFFDDPC